MERNPNPKTQTQQAYRPIQTPALLTLFPFSPRPALLRQQPNPRDTGQTTPGPARPHAPEPTPPPARGPASLSASAPLARGFSPTRRAHLSALSSPLCHTSVRWPGRVSRRARALDHPRHVYSPAITAASSTRGLCLLEPGTLGMDRT